MTTKKEKKKQKETEDIMPDIRIQVSPKRYLFGILCFKNGDKATVMDKRGRIMQVSMSDVTIKSK